MASKKRGTAAADKKPPAEPAHQGWPEAERLRGRVPGSHLIDSSSDVCPGCGNRLDFWACEAVCHLCGLKFTCDE